MSSPEASAGPRAGARPELAIELLRIAVGLVWAVNLVFVVDPANHYFGHFASTARSFAPTTLGGPALADFVAAHALLFSWLIALLTTYLAVALITGLTTRWACLLGGIFSAVLLGTQVGSTFVFPGGTDVGEHPLYLALYVGLVVGGAGQAYSLDRGIARALDRRRAARAARPLPVPGPTPGGAWTASVNPRFFVVYFAVGVLIAFGIGAGLVVAIPSPAPTGPAPVSVSYVNLTVVINATNGWPQYVPANFTVPVGRVVFTITDEDSPSNWSSCPCVVTGTLGDVEEINGSPTHIVPSANVAHTFNVAPLGLSIYSPGGSVVQFTADMLKAGAFTWYCLAPCGGDPSPYQDPPMGTPGFMTGTMTVG